MINPRNPREYIESFLRIRTKDGQEVPLRLKPAQLKLYAAVKKQADAGKPVRVIVLKARQMGFSTLISALIFHGAATQENRAGLFMAHVSEATANLHAMHKRFYDGLPEPVRPMRAASNATELRFENPSKDPAEKAKDPGLRSKLRCATAGGSGVGRSDTLQFVHCSEFAFWPDGLAQSKAETLNGILQAVPALPGTMVFIESTANGYDEFQRMWEDACAGRSDFVPVFFAWFEEPGYRMAVPPGTVWTREERAIQKRFGLDDEQLAWRRWAIQNNCGGSLELFHQEYPATPEEAFIASGSCWFDKELAIERLRALREDPPTYRRGSFVYEKVYDEALRDMTITDVRWQEDPEGPVWIYREPEQGVPYVLGGDTAGEGSDWFSGFVIDNTSAQMCAVVHKAFDEAAYAEQIFCLGQFYNTALVGLEVNFSIYPTALLQSMGYRRLYVRRIEDSYTHKPKEAYGFRTDRVTRPAMLAQAAEVFLQRPELICHEGLLQEMIAFVKDEKGRPAAMAGKHDDLVMGWAITMFIRDQQATVRPAAKSEGRKWTRDMWEDYRAATPAQRKLLEAEWGRPG